MGGWGGVVMQGIIKAAAFHIREISGCKSAICREKGYLILIRILSFCIIAVM